LHLEATSLTGLFTTMSSFCDNKAQYSKFFGGRAIDGVKFEHVDWLVASGGEFVFVPLDSGTLKSDNHAGNMSLTSTLENLIRNPEPQMRVMYAS